MSHLLRYCRKYPWALTLIIAPLIVQALCELTLPRYMAGIVDIGIAGGDIPYIISNGLIMLLIALASMGAAVLSALFSGRFAADISRDMRHDVFRKVESFSYAEFDKFSAASLITRTTNDVQQIQQFLGMAPRMLMFAPIIAIGGVIAVFLTDAGMSWVLAIGVAAGLAMIVSFITIATSRFRAIQKLTDRMNGLCRRILTGLQVIRAFGTQKYEERRFDEVNTDFTKINLVVNRLVAFAMPSMMLVMNLATLLVVWAGAGRVEAGNLQVGGLMALITYTMQVIMSFIMISMATIMISRANVSAKRISEVLLSESTVLDPEKPEGFLAEDKGKVEFRAVSFRYPGAETDALTGISFTAEAGKTTAIIGGTGSGKSTIAALLLRFYDVTDGEVCVEGKDVRTVGQCELRNKIGYVPQKSVLLSGSIADNLRYGKGDATADELTRATRTAQAESFIAERDGCMESEISQGGANVSGGQKQRLSIARALVKRPDIYVFDDSFSALDFKTDAALRRALAADVAGSSLIIVA
jgi:ATP-binding cassette subfamily B protein